MCEFDCTMYSDVQGRREDLLQGQEILPNNFTRNTIPSFKLLTQLQNRKTRISLYNYRIPSKKFLSKYDIKVLTYANNVRALRITV